MTRRIVLGVALIALTSASVGCSTSAAGGRLPNLSRHAMSSIRAFVAVKLLPEMIGSLALGGLVKPSALPRPTRTTGIPLRTARLTAADKDSIKFP